MKTEFLLNWRHWLFGVNWGVEEFSKNNFTAIHFGPCCWIVYSVPLFQYINDLNSEPD